MAVEVAALQRLCAEEWGPTDPRALDAVVGGAVAGRGLLGLLDGGVAGVAPAEVLHAEQHVRLLAPHDWSTPVVVGAALGEVVRHGRGAAVEATCTIADAEGTPRQAHTSLVALPAHVDGSAARPPRAALPPRTRALGTARWTPGADLPARYAAASGDHNPVHLDPEVARRAGLPGVVLHGLSVLAFAVHTAAPHAGARPLAEVGARFRRPVPPGVELVAEVWATTDPDTLRVRVATPDGPALRDCCVRTARGDR